MTEERLNEIKDIVRRLTPEGDGFVYIATPLSAPGEEVVAQIASNLAVECCPEVLRSAARQIEEGDYQFPETMNPDKA